jgi:hypothetical protein
MVVADVEVEVMVVVVVAVDAGTEVGEAMLDTVPLLLIMPRNNFAQHF